MSNLKNILEDNITDNINTIPIENPPDFIDEILPFHEFLSISTLGAKSNSDIYVDKSKYQDTCTDYSIDDCEIDNQCVVYKERECINKTRVKKFKEISDKLGSKINGKFKFKPYKFIINGSSNFYKIILSLQTKNIYILFNSGRYLNDNAIRDLKLSELLDSIIKNLDMDYSLVICGHSMGGSIALKCAEIMISKNDAFFRERCTVFALAPFPVLNNKLVGYTNIHVYVTGIYKNDHLYVDRWFTGDPDKIQSNDLPRIIYTPFTLLSLNLDDRTVTQQLIENILDFNPINSTLNSMITGALNIFQLHNLSTYLWFFYGLHHKIPDTPSKGGKRTTKKYKKKSKSKRKSKFTYK